MHVPGAVTNLHEMQLTDGGWGFAVPASPSSSSEVGVGLIAAGHNPFSPDWSQIGDGKLINVADTLIALQDSNGCWPNLYGPGDDPFSTTDAVLLLTQQPNWGFQQTYLPLVITNE